MRSEFNEARPLDLDEQNMALTDWDKRIRRMANALCAPRGHFEPGELTVAGHRVEYCSDCYRVVRTVTDLWADVFTYEDEKADAKARASNKIQFVPVSAMFSIASGLLDPNRRKAMEGYGVL